MILESGSIAIEDWRGTTALALTMYRAGHKRTGQLGQRQKKWECSSWWQGVRPVQAMGATTLHGAWWEVRRGWRLEFSNAFTCFHQLPSHFHRDSSKLSLTNLPSPHPLSSSEYVTSDLTERTVFQSSNPSFLITYSPKPKQVFMSSLALENEEFP